jgi:o-succinylbenzoate synthase
MFDREIWIVQLFDSEYECFGIGECAPLFGLSQETKFQVEEALAMLQKGEIPQMESEYWQRVPSVCMAYEMAKADLLNGGKRVYFGSGHFHSIPINGLVWMNERDTMLQEAFDKIEAGYTTIKLKVGSLDFDQELSILEMLRDQFSSNEITIRLDANGAFQSHDVFRKLEKLAQFDIHSIEQPVRAGQHQLMRSVCESGIIPVALDEELIGVNTTSDRAELLELINPHYIILKPSLHGAFAGANEWVQLATNKGIGWWATSALESSFGLLAIAQWVSQFNVSLPQGLGTGSLYSNNFASSLEVRAGFLTPGLASESNLPEWI